jgi:hypothetical protein
VLSLLSLFKKKCSLGCVLRSLTINLSSFLVLVLVLVLFRNPFQAQLNRVFHVNLLLIDLCGALILYLIFSGTRNSGIDDRIVTFSGNAGSFIIGANFNIKLTMLFGNDDI